MLSWSRSSFVGVALAVGISAVHIGGGGQSSGKCEHYALSGKLVSAPLLNWPNHVCHVQQYNSPMVHSPAHIVGQGNQFPAGMDMEYDQAFRHQIEPTGSHLSSNCPDIQVALLDVLQNQVFIGSRSHLNCLVLDAMWNEIVDASLFSGLHYDGKMQARTFEELVSFNYGETFLISAWEYSNPVTIYGEHFARVTFDLRIATECQGDAGNNHKYFHEQVQLLVYCRGAVDKITELHRTHNEAVISTFLHEISDKSSCQKVTIGAWNGTFPPPPSICYHL